MIIYNVTIKVNPDVLDEWLRWMKEEHIPDVLATGMFHEHKMCRLLEQDERDGITFVIQFLCVSLESYRLYIEKFAPRLREETNRRFEGKLVAFRTLMEEV